MGAQEVRAKEAPQTATPQKSGNGIKIAIFPESRSTLNYQENNSTRKNARVFPSSSTRVRISSLKIFIFFLFFLSGISLSEAQTTEEHGPAKKQGPYKVAILPVAVNSPENVEFMREGLLDMLSSRIFLEGRVEVLEKRIVKKALSGLSGEIDAETAKKLGVRLEVRLGARKLDQARGQRQPGSEDGRHQRRKGRFLGFCAGEENGRDRQWRRRNRAEGGREDYWISLTPPATVAKVEKPSPEAPVAPAPLPGFRPAMPSRSQAMVVSAEFWQSQSFPYRVKGMAVGDFDGDGRDQIALIGPHDLYIYRLDKTGFALVKRFEGDNLDNYLAVDVGDINKDGKAEVFVTNLQKDRLQSFVVAFSNGAYQKTIKDQDWFFRVVEWGSRGSVLLGQGKGQQSGFIGPIFEMAWDGKKYKDVRKIDASDGYSVYGFSPFEYNEKTYHLFIDSQFRLRVTDAKGKDVWKSTTLYGTDISFQAKPVQYGSRGVAREEGDEFEYINVRTIVRKNESTC